MNVGTEELAEFKGVCPSASVKTEGAQEFIDLPALRIPVGDQIVVRDALLTMQNHGGYVSRLFLSAPIPGRGQNWTTPTVLGRTWHTPSWQHVAPGRPIEMLIQHLSAYR
jgi:hypothetical protein